MTQILVQVYVEDDVDEKELFEAVEIAINYSAERGELELESGGCVFPDVTLVTHK
jgi:hypothetical protein